VQKKQEEQELKRKHLLYNDDKIIMHKLLCACIQQKEDYLFQKSKNEALVQGSESYTQNLLEGLIENPLLSWERRKRKWKYHQKFGEKCILRIRRILTKKKKHPDKWSVMIRKLEKNIWKWLSIKLGLQWSDYEEKKMLQ
jgi:hypothetical protein